MSPRMASLWDRIWAWCETHLIPVEFYDWWDDDEDEETA